MQMNGLGDSASNAAHARARYAAAKRAAAAAANQALLNVQLHNFYLAKLAAYTAASTAEAKALLGVATANAGTNQTAINQAVNTALICENNSLMAYEDMSAAAQQDNTLQAQLAAQATAAAYAAAKAALLPAGGYWNTGSPMQYAIDAPTFAAMQSGRTIYNWWGATSVMLGRPVLCFCNNFYRANPKCTLDQVNSYGGQLEQAAQSSDSFGSFLMGALPYIAIVAVIATAVVFTAGALAPAASSALTTGSGAALTTGGTLTNAQIVAAGTAEGDAGGGAIAAASTGTAATLGTGAASGLSTGASGLLTSVETAGGAVATSTIESRIVGGIKNLLTPKQTPAPIPGTTVAPAKSSFLTPAIMVAGIGLVFELLKN